MRNDVLAYVVGLTLMLLAGPLFLMIIVGSLFLDELELTLRAFSLPSVISLGIGYWLITWGVNRGASSERLRDREAFAAVALGWPVVVLIGALPYWFGGMFHGPFELISGQSNLFEVLGGYIRAFFESMSGFTTTGATVIDPRTSPVCQPAVPDCINAQSRTLLLWRSLSQWLGGMGIIMLGMLLLARYLGGGMTMARAELTGPSLSRLKPRIQQTAKILWSIYTLFTIIEIGLLYYLADMGLFDAVNHGLTTLPSGGFSTYDAGIMSFDYSFQTLIESKTITVNNSKRPNHISVAVTIKLVQCRLAHVSVGPKLPNAGPVFPNEAIATEITVSKSRDDSII